MNLLDFLLVLFLQFLFIVRRFFFFDSIVVGFDDCLVDEFEAMDLSSFDVVVSTVAEAASHGFAKWMLFAKKGLFPGSFG